MKMWVSRLETHIGKCGFQLDEEMGFLELVNPSTQHGIMH